MFWLGYSQMGQNKMLESHFILLYYSNRSHHITLDHRNDCIVSCLVGISPFSEVSSSASQNLLLQRMGSCRPRSEHFSTAEFRLMVPLNLIPLGFQHRGVQILQCRWKQFLLKRPVLGYTLYFEPCEWRILNIKFFLLDCGKLAKICPLQLSSTLYVCTLFCILAGRKARK